MPHFTTQTNLSLYYEIHGSGQPVLLIHGLGSSGLDWENQIPALSPHYQVITVDVRGHGRSAKPPGPYSIPMFTQDILELIQHLQIEALHLVGLSMGGMISFQMMVDKPEIVKSAVILNSGPALKVRTFKERMAVWTRKFLMRALGLSTLAKVLSKRLFPEPDQQPLRDLLVSRWVTNDPKAYYQAFLALIGWGVEDRIGQIRCPVLVLTADMDYTPVSFKEAYAAQMPNAKVQVLKNSRHASTFDQPEQVNQALLAFLQTVA